MPGQENNNSDESKLVTVKRVSIRGQIFDQIKEKIVSGIWTPGTKIPSEKDLTRILGVSRLSLREALQKLVALDLLETRQGEGTFVKKIDTGLFTIGTFPFLAFSRNGIYQILQFRRIVETGAIELAINNASNEDIEELERYVGKMREAKINLPEHSLEDFLFHMRIIELSKNAILINLYNVARNGIIESMRNMVTAQGKKNSSKYHGALIQDFINKDIASGQKHIYQHLSIAIERILNDERIHQI